MRGGTPFSGSFQNCEDYHGNRGIFLHPGRATILLTLLGVYGRVMDTKMWIFIPIISLASGVFLSALYRNIVRRLQGIWQQWGDRWSRDEVDLGALAKNFVIEVFFNAKLYRDDRLRWAWHIFITGASSDYSFLTSLFSSSLRSCTYLRSILSICFWILGLICTGESCCWGSPLL